MKDFRNKIRIWLLLYLLCAVATIFAFVYLDMPVAQWCFAQFHPGTLGEAFSASTILLTEATVAATVGLVRLVRGRLSPFEKALLLACLTSICAYAVNDNILKVFFGVPSPARVFVRGVDHSVHFFAGAVNGSFPSGHMVLVGAFTGVFMKLYPVTVRTFAPMLFIAAALLVMGHWHFLSDVVAGAFVGVSAGLLAGELWRAHSG